MTKTLVIFDIDGTLLQSTGIQMACLEKALLGVFGDRLSRWGQKEPRSTTDSGILSEMFHEIFARPPLPAEEGRFRALFFDAMSDALLQGPKLSSTPGAARALAGLHDSQETSVAIATGAFESVSKLKMDHAGLSIGSIPAAFAEDGFAKEQVLRVSRRRAESHFASKFKHVIYVGDACYDAQAAEHLGFVFVGIGAGARRQRLLDCGASVTIPDLTHLLGVLSGGLTGRV